MKLFFATALLLLISCRDKTAVPEGILPVAKMTDVMWDVMLADGLVASRYPTVPDSQKLDTSTLLYQQIAKAHNTTQQQLKQSLRFYESRPDLLQLIIDSLQKRAALPPAAYNNSDSQTAKKDSLSRKLFKKAIVRPPA